jgi:hypothetical protein
MDSERRIFTDKNDVAAPEVKIGVFWFAKLGYGLSFFASVRIYRLLVPLGIRRRSPS